MPERSTSRRRSVFEDDSMVKDGESEGRRGIRKRGKRRRGLVLNLKGRKEAGVELDSPSTLSEFPKRQLTTRGKFENVER